MILASCSTHSFEGFILLSPGNGLFALMNRSWHHVEMSCQSSCVRSCGMVVP
jgi:hypothetical protein